MSETGFKCPKCGHEDEFTAFEMMVTGPIRVNDYGYEEQVGKGLNYEIPDTAIMECCGCGHRAYAINFRNACMGAWWPKEEA